MLPVFRHEHFGIGAFAIARWLLRKMQHFPGHHTHIHPQKCHLLLGSMLGNVFYTQQWTRGSDVCLIRGFSVRAARHRDGRRGDFNFSSTQGRKDRSPPPPSPPPPLQPTVVNKCFLCKRVEKEGKKERKSPMSALLR